MSGVAAGAQIVSVRVLDENSFRGVELALFSAGGGISRRFAPAATAASTLAMSPVSIT